jgi:hypothetical protein
MEINEAKYLLRTAGYRLIKEYDEELEENQEEILDEGKSREKSDKFSHKQKCAYKNKNKNRKYHECDEDDDDCSIDEGYEEDLAGVEDKLISAGAARPTTKEVKPVEDFDTSFRAKVLLLKKALTPKFISELIKRMNFDIDETDIKKYAVSVIEAANFNAKEPVDALQRKIRRHFTGV